MTTWWTQHARALDLHGRSAVALSSARARVEELRGELLPEQAGYVSDVSQFVSALCSRRAGKSWANGFVFLDNGLNEPGDMSLYVTTTNAKAREYLWDNAFKLMAPGFATLTVQQGQLLVRLCNGHRIWLAGCSDRSEIAKFRGGRYRRAIVDEAQSIPWLKELLTDAIGPALLDYRGQLRLTGTPGPVPAGPFFEATTGSAPCHRWTIAQNTHLGDTSEWLAKLRAHQGWTLSTPTYRREYLGEWVLDREALVYPYDAERNSWQEMPAGRVRTVIGVDLGSTGVTAWVVLSTVDGDHRIWVRHAEHRRQQSTSDVAALTQQMAERWAADVVVVDAGGLGGAYVDDMRKRYGVPVRAADKTTRDAAIQGLAGDLRNGTIRLDRRGCVGLVDEMAALVWDDEASVKAGKPTYSSALPDHYCDAFRYAWRAVRVDYTPEREPPAPGTPAWYAAESARERAAAQKRQRERLRQR